MQLELIGCTGAGKSTLARRIQKAAAKGLAAPDHNGQPRLVLGDDFVLSQFRLHWLRQPLLRKGALNLLGLLAALATWPDNRDFYRFAATILLRLPVGRFEKIQLFRNVLKRIGLYEIIRRRHHNNGSAAGTPANSAATIVLLDEGPLQTAHNLFVHVNNVSATPTDLATFAALVPLSDAIIYLRQPEQLLIHRTMARGHSRIPGSKPHRREETISEQAPPAPAPGVQHFIRQAVDVFEALVQEPHIANRVFTVDGSATDTAYATILSRFSESKENPGNVAAGPS